MPRMKNIQYVLVSPLLLDDIQAPLSAIIVSLDPHTLQTRLLDLGIRYNDSFVRSLNTVMYIASDETVFVIETEKLFHVCRLMTSAYSTVFTKYHLRVPCIKCFAVGILSCKR